MLDKEELALRIEEIEGTLRRLREDLLSTDESVDVLGQGAWRRSMLTALYPHLSNSPGVLALLDEAADHPEEVVSYVAVRNRSGLTDQEQRNEHASLSRLTSRVLGRKIWPLSAWQDPADGIMRYRMSSVVAKWWTELRAA
jgi:hypothetical protein